MSLLIDSSPVGDEGIRAEGMSKASTIHANVVVEPELKSQFSTEEKFQKEIAAVHGNIAKRTTLGKLTEVLLNSSMKALKVGSREWAYGTGRTMNCTWRH